MKRRSFDLSCLTPSVKISRSYPVQEIKKAWQYCKTGSQPSFGLPSAAILNNNPFKQSDMVHLIPPPQKNYQKSSSISKYRI